MIGIGGISHFLLLLVLIENHFPFDMEKFLLKLIFQLSAHKAIHPYKDIPIRGQQEEQKPENFGVMTGTVS